MEYLIDRFGEDVLLLGSGLLLGTVFGFAAYRSRFCLRAATVEVAEGTMGPKLGIWLVAFFSALFSVQCARWVGVLDVGSARQLATTGSMSGAVIGGLMFGCGMVLARGCASRLLVLSASGNLRAIVTGLVLTLTAQASLRGVLAPAREHLATLWTVPGGSGRQLFAMEGASAILVCLAGVALLLSAFHARAHRVPVSVIVMAGLVGVCVFAGWQTTYAISAASFDIIGVESLTFTGPSTDTLMALVGTSRLPLSFGLGLVPGVFAGAMIAAVLMGEARIQRFEPDMPMERYLVGGALMGFGSMLAGGCAVGAGLSGGAILATTAWLAVFCMWVGAILTHWVLTAPRSQTA